MSQPELLKKVVRVLDAAGIDYMVTGSVASSLYGEPRSTHDVDLVVSLDKKGADELVRSFPPPDFYLDRGSIADAMDTKGTFNLLDVHSGDKVDFWLLTDEPFDRSRFSRKRVEAVAGVRIKVSTPEDTILAKLWWSRLSGGSEKQFLDALHVYEVQSDRLDHEYLTVWAKKLGVGLLLTRLKKEADLEVGGEK